MSAHATEPLDYSPQTAPVPNDGLPAKPNGNYLNVSYGWLSWLLTVDHKRIALLYLATITVMFFLGGAAATLIRLELITPQGDLLGADAYNRMFTLHGIIMIFIIVVPGLPAAAEVGTEPMAAIAGLPDHPLAIGGQGDAARTIAVRRLMCERRPVVPAIL